MCVLSVSGAVITCYQHFRFATLGIRFNATSELTNNTFYYRNTWQKFRTDFVDDGRVVSPIAPIIRQLTRLGLLFQIKFHLHHGVRRPNKRSSRRYLVDYQFSGNIEDLLYKSSLDDLDGEMFDNLIRLVLTELTSADLRVEYLSDSSNEERAMDLMVPGK